MNALKIRLACFTVFVCLCWFSACDDAVSSGDENSFQEKPTPLKPILDRYRITLSPFSSSSPYSTPVKQVFGSSKQTVTLEGLSGHSVFLVTVNTSDDLVSSGEVGAVLSYNSEGTNTGAAQSLKSTADTAGLSGPVSADAAASGIFTGDDGETFVRYDKNKENEEIFDAIRDGRLGLPAASGGGGSSGLLRSTGPVTPPSYTVGSSTKTFWALGKNDQFKPFTATLRAQKTHSNVWVADAYYGTVANQITSTQAEELAAKFDLIYEKETPVFGFEYGGGVPDTDPSYGGADGDPKIQILVYDIDEDYSSNQKSGTFGYFYSGDEYPKSSISHSNVAEIFYVDANFTNLAPNMIYSTLAHEFQHMINFNQKTIKSGYTKTAGVWYNEMLSMIAEDLIDPLIGIPVTDTGHPVMSRIPEFLQYYDFDAPTNWDNRSNVLLHYYANAYALGAYLVRNFGGVELVQKIMSDTLVDTDSLDAALASSANPLRSEVSSFTAALKRYGEALLFNQQAGSLPAGVLSFNKTVTTTCDNTNYTFSGFDVWSIESGKTASGEIIRGPYVYTTDKQYALKPRTMLLQSNSAWQNKCGTLEITLQPPAASGVELYVMVR